MPGYGRWLRLGLEWMIDGCVPLIASWPGARIGYFLAARHFTPIIGAAQDGVQFFLSTADRQLAYEVFRRGSDDVPILRRTLSVLAALGRPVSPGSWMLDIGANVGTASLSAVAQGLFAGAVAIEPEPTNFRLLRANAVLNCLDDRVRCVEVAISDHLGTVTLELSRDNSGDHRVRTAPTTSAGLLKEKSRSTIEVASRTLDDLVLRGDVNPSNVGLIWIDTQGHEGYILSAANHWLSMGTPFVIEYWPYALERAGSLSLLHDILETRIATIIDLRSGDQIAAVTDLDSLRRSLPGHQFTDLLLLPSSSLT